MLLPWLNTFESIVSIKEEKQVNSCQGWNVCVWLGGGTKGNA